MVSIWLLISFLSLTYAATPMCYAVSIEGGGSHGAFEAGALWTLAYNSTQYVQWNVVTGISTGALNAGGVAQFAQGQEQAMSDFLINTWLTLNGSASVFVEWDGGLVEGLLFQRGVYDNKPLVKTLNSKFIYGVHRNITIGSTNLDTGLFGQFNETLGPAGLLTAITCSACPPWYFPPTNFLGSTWVDGGVVINLDVFAAVNRCLDVVGDQKQIVVDLIYDSTNYTIPAETNMTTFDVFRRVKEIKDYDGQMWFYYNAITAWPNVNYRYVIFPSKAMPGGPGVPLDFNQTVLVNEVALGKSDTLNVLNSKVDGKTVLLNRYHDNKHKVIYP